MHASTVQTLIRQVIMNGIIAIFIRAQFSEGVPLELVATLRSKCSSQHKTQLFIELVKS